MDNFEGECALVFRREKSKKLLTFQAVSFVKIAAVIEIKKDGIPDWKIKKTSAKNLILEISETKSYQTTVARFTEQSKDKPFACLFPALMYTRALIGEFWWGYQ